MKYLHHSFVLFLGFAVVALGDDPPADPVKAADEMLQKRFEGDRPGAAVLIVRDGKTVLEKGYGFADIEAKKPITPQTQFDLASVSKQFTAMAVMILADRGKLDFEDDARKYLPDLPEYDSKRPIRVRDLLNHTSGLPDYLNVWKGSDSEFAKLTNESVLDIVSKEKLKFPTGSKFEYSNSNYALLALVGAKAAGMPLTQFLRTEIFDSLGMKDTIAIDYFPAKVPNRAVGYRKPLFISSYERSSKDGPVCGDGNVFSTIADFAKWDAALAANKLVKPDTLKRAFTPGKLDNGKEIPYGFGWGVRKDGEKVIVYHGGGWAGTRTFIGRRLEDKFTVVVLCNLENTAPDKIASDVAALFFKPTDKPPAR